MCAAHCSGCGGHFAGNVAFDAHRRGRFNLPPTSPDRRRCVAPETDGRFERVEGGCQLRSGGPARVTIWRLRASGKGLPS
jgi:hypothetical protein